MDRARIQPIVLVGGRSTRFGRDKLREPIAPDRWLVDGPIGALRTVFGPRVLLVGEAHPSITARADGVIADAHPGAGPIGGILSALRSSSSDVFVLAGDLAGVTGRTVTRILESAAGSPDALITVGRRPLAHGAPQIEPCIGLYRLAGTPFLERAIASADHSLMAILTHAPAAYADLDDDPILNVNRPEDLR